jgi:hypothetical protein
LGEASWKEQQQVAEIAHAQSGEGSGARGPDTGEIGDLLEAGLSRNRDSPARTGVRGIDGPPSGSTRNRCGLHPS